MAEIADMPRLGLADLRERALDLLGQADSALDGRLWVPLVGLALFLMILATPPRRLATSGPPWPRLFAGGAVGGLATLVLLIFR